MPFGCIGAVSLRALADVVERLDKRHEDMFGRAYDAPCLRRIECDGDRVVAHVSSGPAVGGTWFSFVLEAGDWKLIESCGAVT